MNENGEATMNTSKRYLQILEAPLLIPSNVKGENIGNYEQYLIEVLNASHWMKQHHKAPFRAQIIQDRGQCDTYSDQYGLDFKLIASESAMQAVSILSLQTIKEDDHSYTTVGPDNPDGHVLVTNFPNALHGKTIEDLLSIRAQATNTRGMAHDINSLLNKLETKKNLLLFFPYRFRFEKPGDKADDILTIVEAYGADFGPVLSYRSQKNMDLDTFFVFMYDYDFILCKWENNHLQFLEQLDIEVSNTFMHISQTYCDEWRERYDVILQMLNKGMSVEEIDRILSSDGATE